MACNWHVPLYLNHVEFLNLFKCCWHLLRLVQVSHTYLHLVNFLPVFHTRLMLQSYITRTSDLPLTVCILWWHYLLLYLVIVLRHECAGYHIADMPAGEHTLVGYHLVLREIKLAGHHVGLLSGRRHHEVHLEDLELDSLLLLPALERDSHRVVRALRETSSCLAKGDPCLVQWLLRHLLLGVSRCR